MYRQHSLKKFSVLMVFVAMMTLSSVAKAERPTASNIYAWLVNMGRIAFDGKGGFFLPVNVITGLRDGRYSDFSQLILFTHTMNSCVKNVIRKAPGRKTPYRTAAQIFENGLCKLTACFQQALSTAILTETNRQLRASPGLTDAQRNEARQQIALAMFQSFKNNQCKGNGRGYDPGIFILLGGLQSR